MSKQQVRVLCVDDHAFFIEGLQVRLGTREELEFVGHLGSADQLSQHVDRLKPDVILIDIEMPGADVFEALKEVRRRTPDVRAILLSAHVRDHYLDQAYEAGAWGYFTKADDPQEVIDGVLSVARGETAFSPRVLARAQRADASARSDSRIRLLTARELEILKMIARGLSRTEIAEQLSRSPMTVDNHRKSIMSKLGIHDRVELTLFAINEGLVEPGAAQKRARPE